MGREDFLKVGEERREEKKIDERRTREKSE